VTNSIGIGDGGGSYFDLHTGAHGFGSKVNDQTMLTYLRRFGVPENRIQELGLKTNAIDWTSVEPGTSTRKVGDRKICTSCRKKTSECKACSKCSIVPYCSKECQKSDWPIHKLFCGLTVRDHAEAENDEIIKRVKVFVFPENGTLPEVRYLERTSPLNYSAIIRGNTDKISSDLFTDRFIRSLPMAYDVICKDDANIDGSSTINKCVLHLFQKWEKKNGSALMIKDPHWRNHVVIVKRQAGKLDAFEDVADSDATEIVKFLYRYTAQKSLIIYG
jgi:hypothetical protein